MTDDKIALRELLEKGSDATFLREMIGFAAQRLMELESERLYGARHGERSDARRNHRNGYRDRDWETRAGTVQLRIPKLRKGSWLTVGDSEAEPFWTGFLRGLRQRGLRGVKLVISDAHDGLKAAITKSLDATWQRCRFHFMRNAMAHAGKTQRASSPPGSGPLSPRPTPTRREPNGARSPIRPGHGCRSWRP